MQQTLLLGTRKGLVILGRDAEGAWRQRGLAHPGVPVSAVLLDERTGSLWVGLDHGHWGAKLSRSRDGGQTWEEIAAPAYPEGSEVKEGKPATLEYIWALAAGGPDQPGRLWAGTNPGGLFRSDDDGQSWTLVDALWNNPWRKGWFGGGRDTPGIHSIVLDPRDSRRIFIAVSCAGVFESQDDGQSWAVRNKGLRADFLPDPSSEMGQDPHLIAACPAHPDVLWQQNHCGVFRSVDGGQLWTEISQPEGPARFGFAVAAHPTNPEVAWLVPAVSDEVRNAIGGAMVVCKTEDGGRSWRELRRGLPQELCFDLVYRHGLDIDGDTLAFGSTTGNLFVSDDGGETWQAVTHHLPPVYVVKLTRGLN